MPTKYRGPDGPDLKNETAAVLLAGWSAEPPPGVPLGPHGFGGGLLECYSPGGMAALWRQHADWLRAQAAVWGWTPTCLGPDGVRRFFAEALAWEGDRGEQHAHNVPNLPTDEHEDDGDGAA